MRREKKMTAEQIEDARYERRLALRREFERIEKACDGIYDWKREGHKDAFLLCCSATDNAGETAKEQGFEWESLQYWECVISSLESLVSYSNPRIRRFFKRNNFGF